MSVTWPEPHPPERLGKPTRKSATAAIEAHLEVVKGEPLRRALATALGKAENLGGQERRFVALATRELSRHLRLLDLALKLWGQPPSRWHLAQDQVLLRYVAWRRLFGGADWARIGPEVKLPGPLRPRTVLDEVLRGLCTAPLPPFPASDSPLVDLATRHSQPRWLSERLAAELPSTEWEPLFAALNRESPLQLRLRPGLSRPQAQEELAAEQVETRAFPALEDALVVEGAGHRVFDTALLRRHAMQVQDVGSQLIVALCGTAEELAGRKVADVCAGAGGKTLALADRVGPGGQVHAGDTSKRRLQEARDRARLLRLSQVSFPSPLPLGKVDVALVDAPCSGVGSLAREPDTRWRLTPARVTELAGIQSALLAETAAALPVGAVLVYATCSLLREENEDRVEAFLAAHPGWQLEEAGERIAAEHVQGPYLRVWPQRAAGGGFFAARLRRTG